MSKVSHPIVVGVGASAGGLEAFQQLITGLPENHDMVVVLVQHLDPDHESLMPELVAAKTKTPVHSVTDNVEIEPGHIYLMPPGFEMEIEGTHLRLLEFTTPRGLRRPIDRFFTSLAKECGENAVAVVLSGTGSDGANGAREVKGAGGLVFVQDPRQAKYDGMPRSVLDLSGADVVTEAEEIIDVVRDYFKLRRDSEGVLHADEEFFDRVIRQVRFRTGHDFSEYKEATMRRRIAVRMSVLNLSAPSDYLSYLIETKNEADLLFRDLLINVTSFFRDSEHFETLRRDVIPELVERTEEHDDLRVWVAGCSTGEEAYSIGMLVAEEISRVDKQCNVVIFGTDIDEQALAAARLGRYPDATVAAMPEHLRERYLKPTQDGFEVGSQLREMVRFSRHSFIKDPPFSKIDLLSCRNVLIYLNDNLQDLSARVFHYAIRPGGFLFLGPSENPKSIPEYFEESSARARLFRRRKGAAKPLNLGTLSGAVMKRRNAESAPEKDVDTYSETERVILEEFAPAYIRVAPDGKVVFASSNAARYLSVRPGVVSTSLFDFIAPELEATFRRVNRLETPPGDVSEFEFQGDLQGETARLIVAKRQLPDGTQLYVIRDKLELLESRPSSSADIGPKHEAYVRQLEVELDEAKQAVRTTVEELETSNEELKSSNEEMMSMNEELQSANEELTTINDELQEKLRALNQANLDLKNFVQSTRIPTVFLDGDLKLLRFTPEAEAYFSFTDSDIGRPMVDLNSTIDQSKLLELCTRTISDQREREEEFQTNDGEISLAVRVMPFAIDGKQERGVVFTLQDVTELRDAISEGKAASELADAQRNVVEQIYETSPMAMGLIDRDMRYVRLDSKLAQINGIPVEAHYGKTIREIIPDVADHTEALVKQVFETEEPVFGERVTGSTRIEPEKVHVWESDWVPFYDNGECVAVAVNAREITEQVETAANLRQIMNELEHRVKNMLSNVNALINRAAREATTDTKVFETLVKRVQGLSQTHSLLTAEEWSSAELRQVIELETVQVYGADRVNLSGPAIRITSEATLALGMAFHELATNAAKYGALSESKGEVTVSWSRITDADGDRLVITWTERGGPEITAPERAGFGTRLIASTLEGSLNGRISQTWEPEGLKFVVNLDFDLVTSD